MQLPDGRYLRLTSAEGSSISWKQKSEIGYCCLDNTDGFYLALSTKRKRKENHEHSLIYQNYTKAPTNLKW